MGLSVGLSFLAFEELDLGWACLCGCCCWGCLSDSPCFLYSESSSRTGGLGMVGLAGRGDCCDECESSGIDGEIRAAFVGEGRASGLTCHGDLDAQEGKRCWEESHGCVTMRYARAGVESV